MYRRLNDKKDIPSECAYKLAFFFKINYDELYEELTNKVDIEWAFKSFKEKKFPEYSTTINSFNQQN